MNVNKYVKQIWKFCELLKYETRNAISDYHLILLGNFIIKINIDLICAASQYLLSWKLGDFIYWR